MFIKRLGQNWKDDDLGLTAPKVALGPICGAVSRITSPTTKATKSHEPPSKGGLSHEEGASKDSEDGRRRCPRGDFHKEGAPT